MIDYYAIDMLTDGELDLAFDSYIPKEKSTYFSPTYRYNIFLHGKIKSIGHVTLRTDDNEITKYAGHIGYEIVQKYRGHHYAQKACRIIAGFTRALGRETLLITCNTDNAPSFKTIEALGARYLDTCEIAHDSIAYRYNMRVKMRYEWNINTYELIVSSFMRIAVDVARRAVLRAEIPVGAIIVQNGRILAGAHNERETGKDPSAHAEILALQQAAKLLGDWRLNACTLYVTLEPCAMCAGAIVNARIKRVVFGAFDEYGCCGSAHDLFDGSLGFRPAVIGGILEYECKSLLKKHFLLCR